MTATSALPASRSAPRMSSRSTGERLGDAALAFVVFLGGFVLFEPAPYELLLIPLIVGWTAVGLRINRHSLPMIALMVLFAVGGILSVTQLVAEFDRGAIYVAVTIFLLGSSVFFASIVADSPTRRLRAIMRAYIASAVTVSLLAIVTFFELVPGSEMFKVAGRAAGAFQDPNVFGPFLALPLVYLGRRLLTQPLRATGLDLIWFLIVAMGIFLAFSRAAWGLTAVAFLIVALLSFVTLDVHRDRLRLLGYFAGALVVLPMIFAAIVIAIPEVGDLLEQRAQLVQYYDGGQLGRFDRIIIGFSQVPDQPLGLGPWTFGNLYGNDEHNTWLKGFNVYGWVGGVAYIALVLWTIAASFPLLFRRNPWTPLLQAAFAVFIGHVMIHMVIDNDHWRHLFLIYGLIWGIIAAEKTADSRRAAPAEARTPRPQVPVVTVPAARIARAPAPTVRTALHRA